MIGTSATIPYDRSTAICGGDANDSRISPNASGMNRPSTLRRESTTSRT